MKYIINTGCSYGVMFMSFKEFTKGNNNQFKIIDLHCDSTGADYAKRSVFYTVSKLLQRGVSPKDMYVITEWSQPNRLYVELPQELCGEILNCKNHNIEDTFVLDSTFRKIDTSDTFIKKYKSLTTVFDNRVYANVEHSDLKSFDNKQLRYYIKEFVNNSPINNKPIDRLESYLTNILDLQNFLKSLDIQYSFFLMNNSFEGYYENFSNFSDTDITRNLVQQEKIVLPNINGLLHIRTFSDYLSKVWTLIDLSNFHFYKTENFSYGGIDEYTMEKFGHQAYTAAANPWDIPDEGYVTSFGAHPHESVYVNFFIDYIYEKIKPFMGEFEFDFTDRWSRTKHNALRQTEGL
jgi:hypothetical protein